jgi:hypothetical protein
VVCVLMVVLFHVKGFDTKEIVMMYDMTLIKTCACVNESFDFVKNENFRKMATQDTLELLHVLNVFI